MEKELMMLDQKEQAEFLWTFGDFREFTLLLYYTTVLWMMDLYEAFLRFGTVPTAQVMMENGRSKGIGYLTFSSADEAGVAILEMNGRVLGSRTVYLSPSQTTQGRSHGMKVETISPSKPCPDPRPNANKNIHPQSDLFLPYGNITSAKVVLHNGRSKGFGFVRYSSLNEDTIRIKAELNGKLVIVLSLCKDGQICSWYQTPRTAMQLHEARP
ncbi:polyadenylate-binding protein 4 isoform X1 [Silurus asotus]|uniref:Polyadenylate-binding protein 4 isoform X1 n=1 Tax=Silurus asotus TaxID=30991 RepID=A0AAD5B332_SILAS|nr:polyadenylate-binding protein 4 isoform X1 [Silurus asotus]